MPSRTTPETATHEVENQTPPLVDYDLYETDRCLVEAVHREGAGWAEERLGTFGAKAGSAEVIELGHLANRHVPELRTHDRFGHRVDEVAFHPAWHELMALGMAAEQHALPWNDPRPGAHVARAAIAFMMNQVESGVCCPLAMTLAGIPALRHQPEVAAEWEPRLRATRYDQRPIPTERKTSAIDSPPSLESAFSMSRLTPPEPGKMTNSRAVRSRPASRAARITSAACSRST